MGTKSRFVDLRLILILTTLLICLGFSQSFSAVSTGDSDCMICHRFTFKKTLPSGEKMVIKVDLKQLRNSVHAKLSCVACHKDFANGRHPYYHFKTKKEYMIKMSELVCKRCHTDESLKKRNPVHYQLSKTAPCIKCHGYHDVKPITVAKKGPVNQYCLLCHRGYLTKRMKDGEILSVHVNEEALLKSVHGKLKCTDCHKDFSKEKHPFREFKSIKDYRAQADKICSECHAKEVKDYKESIHAQALAKGKSAPDCLKCHGYHNVAKISNNRQLQFSICAGCHKKETIAFKDSIHYKAFSEKKPNAPTCSSCHGAHKVLPINIANINSACVKCHKGIRAAHNKWLYNPPFTLKSFVDVHFKGASCSACHVKGKKAIFLTLMNMSNNKPLTLEEVSKVLKVSPDEVKSKIDLNKDGIIEGKELWQFLALLKAQYDVNLKGRLDIINPNDAHRIVSKEGAVKDCTVCHNPQAKFVGRLEINREGSTPEIMNMQKKVVNSIYAVPNIRHFYVLGLTKITILDILFAIAVLCGLGVAFGHLGLRIITTPIRRKRKGGF